VAYLRIAEARQAAQSATSPLRKSAGQVLRDEASALRDTSTFDVFLSATDLALDGIQSADAFDGFSSNRRSERYMEIVELAPYMGPARSFLDAAISIEMMEAGVAIRLQRAATVAQMLARMFSLAIG
jgi:hypothetical protein